MSSSRRALVLGLGLLAGGCSTVGDLVGGLMGKKPPPVQPPAAQLPPAPPPPPPKVVPERKLDITVDADTILNLDPRNAAAPVVLRIYVLKAAVAFQSADFFSLFDRDQSTLGADLLSRDEMILRPGDKQTLSRPLGADGRLIAVMAAFRDLERSTWRAVAQLPNPPEATATPPATPIGVPVRVKVGAHEVVLAGIG